MSSIRHVFDLKTLAAFESLMCQRVATASGDLFLAFNMLRSTTLSFSSSKDPSTSKIAQALSSGFCPVVLDSGSIFIIR